MGAYITVDIDGEKYRLSPHEMPGEIEWRIDLIRWLIARTFHRLSTLPSDGRIKALVQIEDELIRKTNLHPIEARAVAEGALLTLDDVDAEDMPALKAGTPLFDAHVKSEGDILMGRYLSLVKQYGRSKGPESQEKNPGALATDWNWAQFLDW
ncbi:hypothetical protein FAZ95_03025 [Trinickia violacea]|uniref:Uncharacterized protein n=1 Tax=Trinickia violacea TaxID=2571746 RepID=A0A4P8IL32_9BURK|nr:hypothetical protein [Trinickia violacea]QCP48255.1 hypothetical protein FAZ95_03025 [Trinickia violacea]